MNIIFIGGVKFSLDLLKSILENNWSVSSVFSYDDSKKKIYSDFASLDEITSRFNVKHFKVININDENNVEIIKKIKPDLILVMGWSQLLNNDILKIPKLGVIGSHPTELPKYRGRAPIPWSILKGLKESALTFFYVSEGTDDGDILAQQKFRITDSDDATSIYDKITEIGKTMILENLQLIRDGKIKKRKQNSAEFIEYWPKRKPEDGKIIWSKTAKDIHNLIRATTHPYPGAFIIFKNSKLKIWKSSYIDNDNSEPGKIIDVTKHFLKVGTGKGTITLEKINFGANDIDMNELFSKKDIGTYLN